MFRKLLPAFAFCILAPAGILASPPLAVVVGTVVGTVGTAVVAGTAHAAVPPAPDIAAKSHILMDFETGEVLAQHNPDLRLPPASLTKIMTAHLVFAAIADGRFEPETETVVSENAWAAKVAGSKTFIEVNTKVSVRDLLYGVIVQSGNDAAIALAELVAGSESAFAQMMNAAADEMGLADTRFQNATGLPDDDHYASARDLAQMIRRAVADFPTGYKIYAEKEFTYNNITQPNRNGLVGKYDGADGVKTGYTKDAGYCLGASAQRGERRLIAVVMGAKSVKARERETIKLFNYGFQNFVNARVFNPDKLREARLWKGEKQTVLARVDAETGALTLPREQARGARAVFVPDSPIVAPVAEGQRVGIVRVVNDGDALLREYEVVAAESVATGGFVSRMTDEVKLRLGKGKIDDGRVLVEW